MSQESEILRRLETGVTLTPLDALHDPEISSLRLGARIGASASFAGYPGANLAMRVAHMRESHIPIIEEATD